jgi:hypothetical protein
VGSRDGTLCTGGWLGATAAPSVQEAGRAPETAPSVQEAGWAPEMAPLYRRLVGLHSGTLCTGGWVGSRDGLDESRKSRFHRDSIPRPSSPQRVATPIYLSRPTFKSKAEPSY